MTRLSERSTYLLSFLLTAGLLGITFYLQKFDGFIPCPLCILQRITLGSLYVIFLLAWLLGTKKIVSFVFALLASLISLLGILLSGRQVWLQHLPKDKNAGCGVSLQYLMHALPFKEVVAKVMQGTAECSEKGWEFLNLSLASWSLIWFVIFFGLCLIQLRRAIRRGALIFVELN